MKVTGKNSRLRAFHAKDPNTLMVYKEDLQSKTEVQKHLYIPRYRDFSPGGSQEGVQCFGNPRGYSKAASCSQMSACTFRVSGLQLRLNQGRKLKSY